ncbi:MAG: hypothetical protein QXG35_10605, partial [Nitrososphaerota archaeon]
MLEAASTPSPAPREDSEESPVFSLSLDSGGWVIRLPGGAKIRYSGDLLSSEFDAWLAEELGIGLMEAWKLKSELIANW